MFARLNLSAISGLYCICYALTDKSSENSAKKGAYLNVYSGHFSTLGPLLYISFGDTFRDT